MSANVSNVAAIAQQIVEGQLSAKLHDCKNANGEFDMDRVDILLRGRFPTYHPTDMLQACAVALWVMRADAACDAADL